MKEMVIAPVLPVLTLEEAGRGSLTGLLTRRNAPPRKQFVKEAHSDDGSSVGGRFSPWQRWYAVLRTDDASRRAALRAAHRAQSIFNRETQSSIAKCVSGEKIVTDDHTDAETPSARFADCGVRSVPARDPKQIQGVRMAPIDFENFPIAFKRAVDVMEG
jgi:hypothetical protein